MPKTVEELEAEATALQGRIDELSDNIRDGLEGERTWTTAEIAAFRQELADLKATTAEVLPSLTASLTELKEQLTQLSQETAELKSKAPPTILPPVLPKPPKKDVKPEDQEASKTNNRTRGVKYL